MDLYVAGFWVVLAGLTALAWFWREDGEGGRGVRSHPELIVAALYWSAALLTVAAAPSPATRYFHLEHALLLIDAGLFLGLAAIGVQTGRVWILCSASLQLISATAHVARFVTPNMWRLGYQVMEEASSYPALLLLAWGIVGRRRRQRRRSSSRSSSGSHDPR